MKVLYNMERYENEDSVDGSTFTKYKIVVPSERDKKELEEAFEHLHYTDCDAEFIAVNQLIHEYLTPEVTGNPKTKNNIIVDKELYDNLSVSED